MNQHEWAQVLASRHAGALEIDEPWRSLFEPLVANPVGALVVGQLGQSLDGRIATPSGHSHYINGTDALVHLHRLRALMDAVVVGIGTAVSDDPRLNVRHVGGPCPARVVIDPQGRLPRDAKLLADDGCRRIVVMRTGVESALPPGVERLPIAADACGLIAPRRILEALDRLGLRRILIEGGALTISRFLQAGCLDRLHLSVAPLIIGSGPTGLTLDSIERLDEALRPPMRRYVLGNDLLYDIALRS